MVVTGDSKGRYMWVFTVLFNFSVGLKFSKFGGKIRFNKYILVPCICVTTVFFFPRIYHIQSCRIVLQMFILSKSSLQTGPMSNMGTSVTYSLQVLNVPHSQQASNMLQN